MRRLFPLLALLGLAAPGRAALYSVGLDKAAYTSDFMIGRVVVSVIFPESDGSLDSNTETWSESRKTQALSKIMSGLDWWTRQNPHSPLSFTFVTETVATKYEPVSRPYYDEALWIPDVMGKLGYSGTRFASTKAYINHLRNTTGSDWGFVIFVVDSVNDANGKFADGYFAYAYLGGPFVVMTYDNNGYGIGNMDVVAAHETGHIFHALDEYAGASSPNDYSYGYFPTVNGNHAYSPTVNDPSSIMLGGLRWGLDAWARQMIGWRDSNKNGRDDIMDVLPTAQLGSSPINTDSDSTFQGNGQVNVLPRQGNANGYGFTLDTIAKVEYRVRSGSWVAAEPSDGLFDSAVESFRVVLSASQLAGAQSLTAQDVDIRVVTAFALLSGANGLTPPDLSNAHAFPNPFKPNSGLGHVDVTFTELTPGAKVQIFTAAGEPVYEKTAVASTLQWPAITDSGKQAASGVYYYFITNAAGQKKTGKIAVIR